MRSYWLVLEEGRREWSIEIGQHQHELFFRTNRPVERCRREMQASIRICSSSAPLTLLHGLFVSVCSLSFCKRAHTSINVLHASFARVHMHMHMYMCMHMWRTREHALRLSCSNYECARHGIGSTKQCMHHVLAMTTGSFRKNRPVERCRR